MAVFVLGDIQGCFYSFQSLLDKVSFNPKRDQLWLVGDLINRGRESLAVLDWCYQNQSSIRPVLGNHELHFLAVALNQAKLKSSDTFNDILGSNKNKDLINWVLNWPLVYFEKNYLVVHAGVISDWTIEEIQSLSKQVCNSLTSHPEKFFQTMYGNYPNQWSQEFSVEEKNRFVINAMTRMRCLNKNNGSLNYEYKGDLQSIPKELVPWFEMLLPKLDTNGIFTGHWSAIDIQEHPHGVSLDSGCVWGRRLTAYNLSESRLISVNADQRDLP